MSGSFERLFHFDYQPVSRVDQIPFKVVPLLDLSGSQLEFSGNVPQSVTPPDLIIGEAHGIG